MLKIYGADLSSPSNKIRYVANLIGLKYEYIRVSIKEGDNKKEEYIKVHPAGKIPAIVDEGFTLFESNAIIKYFAVKMNSDLYPKDIHARAIIDQWIDFISMHVDSAVGKVLFNRVFCKFAKVSVDERSIKDGLRFLDRYLPIIDKQLEKYTYIAGEKISLVDISLLSTLDAVEIGGIDISKYLNIALWRENLRKEDFYQACHCKYGERLEKILCKKR